MDEIVWAVDPQHDTLIGFMDYASAFTEESCGGGLRCRMDLPAECRSGRWTRSSLQPFPRAQEGPKHIVKHAYATEVRGWAAA